MSKLYSVVLIFVKEEKMSNSTRVDTGIVNKCLWGKDEADVFLRVYDENKNGRYQGFNLSDKSIMEITHLVNPPENK